MDLSIQDQLAERALREGADGAGDASRMSADHAAQSALEAQLRQCTKDESFEMYYQPKVSARTGCIKGAEALLRWRHPDRGMVCAGEIVPVLESLGLIEQVGAWALRRAAHDHANWLAQGLPNIRVAVNVSAAQLRLHDFVDTVLNALGNVSPTEVWLDLEVTESTLMHDVETSTQKMHRLQTLGIRIAIDDFGSGYSSLSRLANMPISVLKMDASFARLLEADTRHAAVVRAMLSLARSLEFTTVAKGIETEKQSALLSSMGCDELQGHLFSHAISAADFAQLLRSAPALKNSEGHGVRNVIHGKFGGRSNNGHSQLTQKPSL
jgi:EAL domain-containing protein (putative c-di-GMP-specific phosphodiesterase class I)